MDKNVSRGLNPKAKFIYLKDRNVRNIELLLNGCNSKVFHLLSASYISVL